jgi:hypothetical protein
VGSLRARDRFGDSAQSEIGLTKAQVRVDLVRRDCGSRKL